MQIKDVVKAIKCMGDVITPMRIGEIDPDKSKNFEFRKTQPERFIKWVKETFANNIKLFKNDKVWYYKRFLAKKCCTDSTNLARIDGVSICYECGFIK